MMHLPLPLGFDQIHLFQHPRIGLDWIGLDWTSQGFVKGEVKRIATKLPIIKTSKTANIFRLPLSIIFYRFPVNIYSDNISCIHSL